MSDCPPEGFITGGMELCLPPTYAQQAMGARESRQPASIALSPAELADEEIDNLVEISSEPGFLFWCPGQKHKGKTFKEVAIADPAYLRWIADKSEMGESEKFTAKHWLGKVGAP